MVEIRDYELLVEASRKPASLYKDLVSGLQEGELKTQPAFIIKHSSSLQAVC